MFTSRECGGYTDNRGGWSRQGKHCLWLYFPVLLCDAYFPWENGAGPVPLLHGAWKLGMESTLAGCTQESALSAGISWAFVCWFGLALACC